MKIGILISGRGSNMVALIDAVRAGQIPGSEVAVVISDRADAAGLAKACERGIETVVVQRKGRSREEHDEEIIAELRKHDVELICLAGYMRLLSRDFVNAFPNRIINIHPSLLPAFAGLDAQRQALEYGVKVSGCTVHFVNEQLDAGRIILQRAVEVKEDDTEETLAARILEQEHRAYVEAVKSIIQLSGRQSSIGLSDKLKRSEDTKSHITRLSSRSVKPRNHRERS
jgi:phosphoribosylglycinamide formyltransferase-1